MGIVAVLCVLLASNICFASAKLTFAEAVASQRERTVHYANTWAVKVPGGDEEADTIALKHGLINRGQIGNQENYYLFMEGETARDVTKDAASIKIAGLRGEQKVESVKQQVIKAKVKKSYSSPTDSGWNKQWSLENTGQYGPQGLDMNVEAAWMQGITGEGVRVALVDDGMEWRHGDLRGNYDSQASHDFIHYDSDPTPDENSEQPNSHGTECAGVVGMKRNSICGVGVAYNTSIGSLKFDVGGSTDAVEASAVGYKDDYIHVYSNSWGPSDFGFMVDGPGTLLQSTLAAGVNQGRGGKGNIYVWAAGNGGHYYDSCAADGYSSSIYTISAGSADQNGRQADYDEDCSAKMAVTFSYNSNTFPGENDTFDPYNQVYTTTLNNQCTDGFTGTSASTPLVAGVIALTLQANSDLTWRDVQYLLAYTSNPDILTGDDWVTNGVGLKVSHHFGFGAIDAEAMVTRARHWTNVPEQHNKTIYSSSSSGTISSSITRTFVVSENTFSSSNQISSLEHVVVNVTLSIEGVATSSQFDYYDFYQELYDTYDNIDYIYDWLQNPHPRRGDIKIELTSPQGTKSVLLPYRNYDFINEEGYDNWPFMSVHFWGENPVGTWTLKITYKSGSGYVRMSGLRMTLYGTATVPSAVSSIPTTCHSSCTRGCSGDGPENCDSCVNYRLASNLLCVDDCPTSTYAYKKYCFGDGSVVSSTPTIPSSTSDGQTTTASISTSDEPHFPSSTSATSTQSLPSSTSDTTTGSTSTSTWSQTSSSTTTTSKTSSTTISNTVEKTTSSANPITSTTSDIISRSTTASTGSTMTNIKPTTTTSNTATTSSVGPEVKQRSSTQNNSKLPLVLGITVGLLVVTSASVVLTGIICVVYIKKRKTKREGFILMTQMEQEVET